MATEVIMPKVDMVMETGTLVEWLKKEGETVCKGDPLFVITSDKAAIEIESPADGILSGVRARPDDVIPVTEVIAYILAPGEALPARAAAQPAAHAVASASPAAAVIEVVAAAPAAVAAEDNGTGKIRATPLARRLAEELQMDITQITGRGPRGRIHRADVLAFQSSRPAVQPVIAAPATAPVAAFPLPDARRKQVIPLAGPRKIISERMAYSALSAPHINLTLSVDMTEAIRLREKVLEPIQARTGQRVSYTAILARAVASVLPGHPYLNSSLADNEIILWEDIHLGIATSVDENLIVPVIREAQSRNLGQIVAVLADLTERARGRRLTTPEMTGSTFTISNLGMYGVEAFTAIINPPEAAILAVGKMADTPVRTADGFEFRPMIQLTLCADHRVVDGAEVARFLADLKATLENPYLLI
ncbi:MAG TPA: dihydrolipoamide acetyltransferase family protein [Anaerolineaceae bacterium]|nr:dihydrolipoamide acetyltransferase family protein [Anaerolineaceae bacterium]